MSRTTREIASDKQISYLRSMWAEAGKKGSIPTPLYKEVAAQLIGDLVKEGYGRNYGYFGDGGHDSYWSNHMWGAY